MNLPQHVFEPSILLADASIGPAAMVLYHPAGVPFDAHKIGKARSSWALHSRLHRLKRRHCPSASKSLTSMESRPKRSRKSRMDTPRDTLKIDPLVQSSRWETSAVNNKNKPPSPSKRGNGRPTLPKRQQSIETTNTTQVASRKARINQASSNNKALKSLRRSIQTETNKARLAGAALLSLGPRCT